MTSAAIEASAGVHGEGGGALVVRGSVGGTLSRRVNLSLRLLARSLKEALVTSAGR